MEETNKTVTAEGGNNQQGTTQEPQTFDDVLKNKDYQSEFDRRVAKALETAKINWTEEFDGKLEEKISEAQKMAKMTAEQKAEHERQKAEEDLQRRIAEVTRRELKVEAKNTLAAKGLPVELADTLNYTNAEQCNASLAAVEKAFQLAVEKRVNEKLRGTPPKAAESTATVTQEQFKKMGYEERLKLKMDSPELYKQLTGGR